METVDYNIVIIPPEEIKQTLINWSKKLTLQFQTDYTLSTQTFLPHLSLYSARYPRENANAIKTALETISKQTASFSVTLSGFSVFNGFIFYDVLKNTSLQTLHEKIVDHLNPLRNGLISDNQRQLKDLREEQKEAIQNYGYVSVKKLYMPHISLTHLKQAEEETLAIELLPKQTFQMEINKINLSPYGAFGTCPGIVEEYPCIKK